MIPIESALNPKMREEIERRALEIVASIEGQHRRRNAEVYAGVSPRWHVVLAGPGQERTAAKNLSERAFGVYLPESEHVEIRRGRVVELKRLMLPGYLFVFVWDIDAHIDRIKACEGVRGVLIVNGQVAILSDHMINEVRKAENGERPLRVMVEVVKRKKRHRRSHKAMQEVDVRENDIVAVHSYSPFIEALRQESDVVRLDAFHKAMGLPLEARAESA